VWGFAKTQQGGKTASSGERKRGSKREIYEGRRIGKAQGLKAEYKEWGKGVAKRDGKTRKT